MITVLRRRFKRYGFQIILWMTMIAMFITFMPTLFDRSGRPGVVVTINGHDIKFPAFAWRLQHEHERIAQFRQRFGPQADMYLSMFGMENPEKNAFDGLVQETLVDQAAATSGLAVDPVTMTRKLLDPQFIISHLTQVIPPYVIDPQTGTIHPRALQEYLNQKGMSQTAFDQSIERALRASTLMGLVATTVHIAPEQLKAFYERTALGRSYGIATFPLDQYIKKAEATPVTDEQLTAFFDKENQKNKRYWVPEKRSGRVWQFTPATFGITISDKQVKADYERNKHKKYIESPTQFQIRTILIAQDETGEVTDALKEKAQKIHEQLSQDPTAFAQLAKEHSDDADTASKGGLSDWLIRDDISSEVRRPLFRLKEDGAISAVITTPKGLEIIQRVARKPLAYKPLESVQDAIKAKLMRQKFNSTFEREARRVIRQAKNNPEAITEFIKDKGGLEQTYTDMARSNDSTVRALFMGKQGGWQSATANNSGILAQVTKVAKKHAPELATVQSKVTKDYYAQQARTLLSKDLKQALAQAKETPLEQVAADFGAAYQKTPFITQESEDELKQLTQAGIPAENILAITHKGARQEFTQGGTGYVAQVLAVEPFDNEVFEAKKSEIAQQLYQEEIERKQRALVASLYRNATLDLSDQFKKQQKA